MYARPAWARQKTQGILSASNPIPAAAIPNIHEEPLQDIQGGLPNEHYHLSEAEKEFVEFKITEPLYYDPVMDSTGEYLIDSNGNMLFSRGPDYVPA